VSDRQERVACPVCGQRFKVDPTTVPEGGPGNKARCRGCEANFFVRSEAGQLSAVVEPPRVEVPEPEAPVSRKRRAARARQTEGRAAADTRPPEKTEAPAPPPLASAAAFALGDRVGRYEVEAVLARGGMGGIFKVYDPAANRHVALKVLVNTATDLDRLRFQREIQVQGNIQHPHILPIFDSGVVGSTGYFTMELLKDPIDLIQLSELLRTGEAAKDPKLRPVGTLEGMVRHVILPVCQAIYHANANEGVLHRDIKPGNVLVDRHGLRPLVIDFGVSSLLEKKNARLAHLDRDLPVPLSGKGISITGTLVFMPPEQARGEADRRGDVWAIGALLHYIVAGEPPLSPALRPVVSQAERIEGLQMLIDQARSEARFSEAREFEEKIAEIQSGAERSVEDLRSDVMRGRYQPLPPGTPKGLEAIIQRAMMPSPERRYRHAMVLHDDLENWLEGRPVNAMVKSAGAAGGALYRLRLFARRHAVFLGILLVIGLAVLLSAPLWPRERTVDTKAVADAHMRTAERHEQAGRSDAARHAALEALRADPGRGEVFTLLHRLDRAERLATDIERARALRVKAEEAFAAGDVERGRRRQAVLEALVRSEVLPTLADSQDTALAGEMQDLLAYAQGRLAFAVDGAPAGCRFTLFSVAAGGGAVRWRAPVKLEAAAAGLATNATVRPGGWVLLIQREQGNVYVPFHAKHGEAAVRVTCPIDPARVDAQSLYVGPGHGVGPTRPEAVQALFWDKAEVTGARYAQFLASLPPEERRRRVPRVAGPLGARGDPLWDREGDRFRTPANALRRPVEGISLYDAKAFAAFEKKRLPTASEWAWAASGPDERLCAVGLLRDALAGGAHVDRPLAGLADGMSSPQDRSPFGLYDMTGNVSEFTATLGSLRGTTGWFVLGGGYLAPPAAVLVSGARVVPGWMPLQGVGFRCVREVE